MTGPAPDAEKMVLSFGIDMTSWRMVLAHAIHRGTTALSLRQEP